MTNRILAYLFSFCMLICWGACKTQYQIQHDKTIAKVIILDTINVPHEDSITLEIIKPYKALIDSHMNEVIAYSEIYMYKDQPEGLLNNFIADLILKKGNEYLKKRNDSLASVCLLNMGGLRSDLPKGAITVLNIFELMPFDNNLVMVEITGTKIIQLLNYLAYKGGMPESGIKMGIIGNTVYSAYIQEDSVDVNKNYRIITSNYLALGGDEMTFFSDPTEYYTFGVKVRDVIIDYLKEQTKIGKTVSAKLDKRIYYEK